MKTQFHNIDPIYDENSRILILGSFPSNKSRQAGYPYAHPQNRFWRVMAAVLDSPFPETLEDKRKMLLIRGVALWDVIAKCEIEGSSDQSIKKAIANNIEIILDSADITGIFTNGGAAASYYKKLCFPTTGIESVKLPSTSPANAVWTLERLISEWKRVLEPVI